MGKLLQGYRKFSAIVLTPSMGWRCEEPGESGSRGEEKLYIESCHRMSGISGYD
jgi:hypothetical protein